MLQRDASHTLGKGHKGRMPFVSDIFRFTTYISAPKQRGKRPYYYKEENVGRVGVNQSCAKKQSKMRGAATNWPPRTRQWSSTGAMRLELDRTSTGDQV